MKSSHKKIADKIKSILEKEFPNIIREIIIYGSRINKNKINADFDISIITNSKINWQGQRLIKNVIFNYGIDNDIVFDPKIFFLQEFNSKKSQYTFRYKIKSEGIRL